VAVESSQELKAALGVTRKMLTASSQDIVMASVINMQASDLSASIKADKELRRKRLEELRASRKAKEESKETERTPVVSSSLTEIMHEVMRQTIPLSPTQEPPKPRAELTLVVDCMHFTVLPVPKALKREQEVQADIAQTEEDKQTAEDVPVEVDRKFRRASVAYTAGVKLEAPKQDELHVIKEIAEEDREVVESSHAFREFVMKSAALMTEALNEEFDVLATFIQEVREEVVEERRSLKPLLTLMDLRYNDRCVSVLKWSPHDSDTLLTTYRTPHEDMTADPYGVLSLWSLQHSERPLVYLQCQSAITSAAFVPGEPFLVLGGTYTGSLLLWDLRAKTTPVSRSPLSPECHTHPICNLTFVQSESGLDLMSGSLDGKVCLWHAGLYYTPAETFDIKSKAKEVALQCFSFLPQDRQFFAGGEDGSLISGILDRKLELKEVQGEQHTGPVLAMDVSSQASEQLLLTSSADWTIKLWAPDQQRDLLTCDVYEDYVHDVKFHPHNPALFAAVDGEGHLDLWHLGKNTEAPFSRETTGEDALNRVAWDGTGHRLATGSTRGLTSVYSLDKELTYSKPEGSSFVSSLSGWPSHG
jgi:dynein intermediate chain